MTEGKFGAVLLECSIDNSLRSEEFTLVTHDCLAKGRQLVEYYVFAAGGKFIRLYLVET